MDCFEAIKLKDWDLIGMHPTCTKMTLSGNRHYAPGKPKHHERIEAVEWTINLWETACKKAKYVYMENPMGAMNTDNRLPKPQIIHPYYFNDPFIKTTCLWLQNLPFLYHNKEVNLFDNQVTHVEANDFHEWTDSKTGKKKRMNRFHYETSLLPSKNGMRATARSKTFPGIAHAIAEQWGGQVL